MTHALQKEETPQALKLDIGCGRDKEAGWTGLDIRPGSEVDIVADITRRSTLDGIVAEEMRMSHLLEHFDGMTALRVMQNLWEIATPDCILEVRVPYGQSVNHWRDPDHRRPYFYDGFNCFSQPYWGCLASGNFEAYGYTADWQPEEIELFLDSSEIPEINVLGRNRWWMERGMKMWNVITEMRCFLRAVKPARPRDESLCGRVNIEFRVPA